MTESAITNSMNNSSSIQGSGPIDTFDPRLFKRTKEDATHGLMKRKMGKPLRSIVPSASNEIQKELKKEKSRGV
jgi:hypothetical protein